MMMELRRRLRGSEDGATAVEYGIMVALIAAVIVAVVIVLGQQVREGLCDTTEALRPEVSDEQPVPEGCVGG